MRLADFAYWSKWHLARAGFSDFDVFLYDSPTPLGFFQPGGRAIAMSLPYVLLCTWTAVMRSFSHEIAHAQTADEREIHGPQWEHAARCNGSIYRDPTDISDEFREFKRSYFADPLRASLGETLTECLAIKMWEEGRERSAAARRAGKLRFDYISILKERHTDV